MGEKPKKGHEGEDETRVSSPPREMPAASSEAPKRRGAYPYEVADGELDASFADASMPVSFAFRRGAGRRRTRRR